MRPYRWFMWQPKIYRQGFFNGYAVAWIVWSVIWIIHLVLDHWL